MNSSLLDKFKMFVNLPGEFYKIFTSDCFLFTVNLTEIAIILDFIHFTKRVIE